MSNVAVSKETKFSSNGWYIDFSFFLLLDLQQIKIHCSSFASVHCSECNMIIGRHYISTKPPFDYLRFFILSFLLLYSTSTEDFI